MRAFAKFVVFTLSLLWLILVLCFSGCGPELTAGGAGVVGGIGFQKTLEGMQADLERKEQALIARYNELVEAGAKAETLEDMKQEIADTVRLRQTSQVAADVSQTDWSNPAAAGGSIAALLATGYAWLKRKDLNNTVSGIKAFRAGQPEDIKHKLDQTLLDKKAAT